jgi:hypothetical protein
MEPSLSTIPEQSLKIYLPELAMEMNKFEAQEVLMIHG